LALYYTPSMALCNIRIAYMDVGKGREQERKLSPLPCGLCRRYDPKDRGGRIASGTAIESNAGAIAEECWCYLLFVVF